MSHLWKPKIVRSRKEYRCPLCLYVIPKGVQYTRIFWEQDGDVGTYKLHNECNELYKEHCLESIYPDENPAPEYQQVYDCMLESGKKVELQAHIDTMKAKYGE